MILKLNIKPTKSTSKTLDTLKSKLSCYGYTCSKHYQCFYASSDEYVYGYVFEKHRRKTKHTKKKVNGLNKTISKPIKESHWVGYKYKFPIALLKIMNVKLVQYNRNFKLEKITM